jgi:mannose-6-phosphate isomerase-like protein (cupin superfamily)
MECYWVLGQRLDFLATGETTGGHYSLFHVFIPAGPPGPLPHIHRDADEFFFVLEGRVESSSRTPGARWHQGNSCTCLGGPSTPFGT